MRAQRQTIGAYTVVVSSLIGFALGAGGTYVLQAQTKMPQKPSDTQQPGGDAALTQLRKEFDEFKRSVAADIETVRGQTEKAVKDLRNVQWQPGKLKDLHVEFLSAEMVMTGGITVYDKNLKMRGSWTTNEDTGVSGIEVKSPDDRTSARLEARPNGVIKIAAGDRGDSAKQAMLTFIDGMAGVVVLDGGRPIFQQATPR